MIELYLTHPDKPRCWMFRIFDARENSNIETGFITTNEAKALLKSKSGWRYISFNSFLGRSKKVRGFVINLY
jgi:hypothetical protein